MTNPFEEDEPILNIMVARLRWSEESEYPRDELMADAASRLATEILKRKLATIREIDDPSGMVDQLGASIAVMPVGDFYELKHKAQAYDNIGHDIRRLTEKLAGPIVEEEWFEDWRDPNSNR